VLEESHDLERGRPGNPLRHFQQDSAIAVIQRMNARRSAGYDFHSARAPPWQQIVWADSQGVGEGSEVPGSRHRSPVKVVREVTSAELRIRPQYRCGVSRRFGQTPASPFYGGLQPLSKGRFPAGGSLRLVVLELLEDPANMVAGSRMAGGWWLVHDPLRQQIGETSRSIAVPQSSSPALLEWGKGCLERLSAP
jgi:hypothetical protein